MAGNEETRRMGGTGLQKLSSDQQDMQTIDHNGAESQELSAYYPAPDEPAPAWPNGHDRRVEDARTVRIEDELARRGITLRGRGVDRCGPCPVCGGDDHFSINIKKQVWNCRGCATGGDVIALVQHIDSCGFMEAVEKLAGPAPAFQPQATAQPSRKTYFDYHDERGAVVYQVERTDFFDGRKKTFRQRRPDPARPGEWLWNITGVQPLPYRLPELLEALAHGRTVAIVEGEAKADLLWSWNIPATCNSGGAKNWKAEHSAYLSGADVVILPDNDPSGRLHLDAVAVSLNEVEASVRVLDLPGLKAKGDIIDWRRGGGTREQLDALIENEARPWAPGERESVNAETDRPLKGEKKPLRIITFTPYVWRAPATIPMRRWLYGKHYIRKFLSATLAAGGLGKSSLDLVEAIAMATGRSLLGVPVPDRLRVAYWGEDPADEIERRVGAILKHFKISREQIEGWLFVDSFRNQPLRVASLEKGEIVFPDAEALTKALIESRIDVLILDPLVKTHGVSENDNAAIDSVARKFNDIAESADCSIELAHHVRKASNFRRSEVTADDGRGAGSLKDAARCVRVANRMTTDEAAAAQVKEKDRKRYFRVDDDGKANMTAPAEGATWFKLISVPLENDVAHPGANGDEIGVVTSWQLPGVCAGLPPDALARVQAQIDSADWGFDPRSGDWAGKAIATALDLSDEVQKERVKGLLQACKASGALKVMQKPSLTTRGRDRDTVVVGNRIEGAAAQDELDF
jgi:AAA domain/CHC2 zinc finger